MGDLNANSIDYPTSLDTYTEETAGENTDLNPVNGGANAAVAIETELGTDPAGSKADVKTFLQTEHGADGEHTFKVPHVFWQDNVAASQSAVALIVAGGSTVDEIEMPWGGSVVGISVLSNESRTADSLTVDATINGSVTGLQAVLDGTNADHHSTTQAKDTDTFNAGDRVGCKITTGGSWTPTSADIIVVAYVSFN
jgi:hypothetical protein